MLGTKRNRLLFPITIIVGVLVVWYLLVGRPEPEARPLNASPIPVVEALLVKETQMPLSVQSQGVVSAATRIQVFAEVNGRVNSVSSNFQSGGTFELGEQLLSIDDTDYVAALSQAKANVADAERALAVEKGSARQAQREWRDLQSTEANSLFLRKPQIASATAALDAAKAALVKAEADLKRTKLTLPFDGRILRQEADLGEYVLTGSLIAEVFALDSAEIRLPLSTDQYYKLGDPVGAQVIVSSAGAGGDFTWTGVIDRVESDVDSVSRLHHVVARLDNPFEHSDARPALALGQYVEASIQTKDIVKAYRIPRSALRQPQDIWVLNTENKLIVAEVEIVERNQQAALIRLTRASEEKINQQLDDMSGGLRVVLSDLSLAVSGMQAVVSDELVQEAVGLFDRQPESVGATQ